MLKTIISSTINIIEGDGEGRGTRDLYDINAHEKLQFGIE
jgi:hypothetical protein